MMRTVFVPVMALIRVALRRFFRDRTALFFTVIFPLIFLFIFGGLFGKSSNVSFNVAVINHSNTPFASTFVSQLRKSKVFNIKPSVHTIQEGTTLIDEGQMDAILVLPDTFGVLSPADHIPTGTLEVYENASNTQETPVLTSVLQSIFGQINTTLKPYTPPFTVVTKPTIQGYVVSPFDYIFSGLLGFSILGLGIFGPTNAFPELRKQGILRRLRTTPLSSAMFISANAISYMCIGVVSLGIMMATGLLVFHLNMRGSYVLLVPFLVLGVLELFGFGMAIGGWARSQQEAAPLTNIIVFPMMFLSGTFFPTYLMPQWLQSIAQYLPLSPVIDGARRIITQNSSPAAVLPDVGLMALWCVVIYIIAFRVFRWE